MPRRDPAILRQLTDVAHALADAARPETLRYFRAPGLGIDNKDAAGFDPVTEADRASERAMRSVLADLRPDDGILGEEYGTTSGTTGLTWVLDPIDGTRAYMAGTPSWGVLVAVSDAQGPILGLIDQPYIGERFFGAPGTAWLDGPMGRRALATRATTDLAQAILFTTFPEIGTAPERAVFENLAARVRLTRYGLDCYAYGLVAAGQVDLVVETGLAPYDIQGPIAVIEAAGGIVTDWAGAKVHDGGRVIAAANRRLHDQVVALLKDTV